MVIKPYGYIWEKMQGELIECLKRQGIKMLIPFPLFVPKACLKLRENAEGFAMCHCNTL
jgi:hypothetical protein